MIGVTSQYREHCIKEQSVPLFSQAWWLDAVAGDANWGAAVVHGESGTIKAAMPFAIQRRWGSIVSMQPPLTQTLGPWLAPSTKKLTKRLSEEKVLMDKLIDQIPHFAHFSQNWSPELVNWLPFYWRGFRQTTRYTYQLADLADHDALWGGLDGNIRTDIKKAQNRYGVTVDHEGSVDEFLDLNEKVFLRQGKRLPYSRDFVLRLDTACAFRNARKILIARDQEGRAHAGAYIVWGGGRAYYLMGGSDPELRGSGAGSLCLWEAIRSTHEVAKIFDFEGSMLEPVERYFRSFGASPTPYFNVSITNSGLWKVREFTRWMSN